MVSLAAWKLSTAWWAAGIIVLIGVGSLAFWNEHLVRRLYSAWNNRIIRPLSNVATAIILRVCLLLVFAATGRAGGRLNIRRSSETMWATRDSNANHTSPAPFAEAAGIASVPNGWIRNYLRWTARSGNTWAVVLIPFFVLLRMVSTEEPTSSGANIYTLF
jgi:hypothetical protein